MSPSAVVVALDILKDLGPDSLSCDQWLAGQGLHPDLRAARLFQRLSRAKVHGSHSRGGNFNHDLVAPEHGQRPGRVVPGKLRVAGYRERFGSSPLKQFFGFLLDSGQGIESGVAVHCMVAGRDFTQFHCTVPGPGDGVQRVLTGHHKVDAPPPGGLHVRFSGLRLDRHGRGHRDPGGLRLDRDGCSHGNLGPLLRIGALVVAEDVVGNEPESFVGGLVHAAFNFGFGNEHGGVAAHLHVSLRENDFVFGFFSGHGVAGP